jgi:hypothetical protein
LGTDQTQAGAMKTLFTDNVYSVEASTEAKYANQNDRIKSVWGAVTKQKMNAGEILKHRMWLLEYYAQKAFYEYYLSGTSASVTLPLTLDSKLQIGRVYEVMAPVPGSTQGRPLFTGYLMSVAHHVGLTQGSGNAITTLAFSHVVVTGVKLSVKRVDPRTANPMLRTLQ